MEHNQVLAEMEEIFRDVLDNEDICLHDETTASDIEEWDSLSHVQLVVAIERHFNIRFKSEEIISMPNVGAMVDTIIKKKS